MNEGRRKGLKEQKGLRRWGEDVTKKREACEEEGRKANARMREI